MLPLRGGTVVRIASNWIGRMGFKIWDGRNESLTNLEIVDYCPHIPSIYIYIYIYMCVCVSIYQRTSYFHVYIYIP